MEIKARSASPQDLRAYLLREQQRLATEIRTRAVHGRAHAGYGNHIADDATEVFEQTKHLALRRGMERRLSEVQAALQRMEDGGYGSCVTCGKRIDPARLRALPSAGLCLSCQIRSEDRKGTSWDKTRR